MPLIFGTKCIFATFATPGLATLSVSHQAGNLPAFAVRTREECVCSVVVEAAGLGVPGELHALNALGDLAGDDAFALNTKKGTQSPGTVPTKALK